MSTQTPTTKSSLPACTLREAVAAGVVLLLAALFCFQMLATDPTGLLVGPQDDGNNDVTRQILAFRNYQRTAWQAGQLPTWNPDGLTGIPWWGNPQSALFYPPNWLFLFLAAESAISWLIVAHHWWAGLGAYVLCRRFGWHRSSALLAGIAFLASPYYIANTGEGHYNPVCLVAWLPWAFLLFERFRRGERGGLPGLAVVFATCFFSGHVQELCYLVLILSAFLAVDIVGHRKLELPVTRGQLFGRWVALGFATIGLVAVDLLPIMIYTRQAVRSGGILAEQASQISLGFVSLLQLLDPLVFGGPGDYRGPGGFYWETVCHFGVGVSLLAVLGAIGMRKSYPVGRFAGLVVFGLIFALGTDTPIFTALHRYFPGVGFFRAPSRILFHTSLAMSVLAAAGLETLLRSRLAAEKSQRKSGLAIAVATIVGCAVLVGLKAMIPSGGDVQPVAAEAVNNWATAWSLLNLQMPLIWAGITAGLLLLHGLLKRPAGLFRAALVLCCLAELSLHAHQVLRVIPMSSIRESSSLVEFLAEKSEHQRVVVEQELLSDREAWEAGIQKLQGYDPVPLTRLGLYLAGLVAPHDPSEVLTGFSATDPTMFHQHLLDLAGVKYMVLATPVQQAPAGWHQVTQGTLPPEFTLGSPPSESRGYVVFENPTAMPRAFVIGQTQPLAADADIVERLQHFDPRQELLVEQDLLPTGGRSDFQPAEIVSYRAGEIVLAVELTAPGYLVLSDVWYPGWTATVDGAPAPVLPANFAFRAVPLTSGKHEIQLTYTPPASKLGMTISVVTMLIIVIFLARRPADDRANKQPSGEKSSTSDT